MDQYPFLVNYSIWCKYGEQRTHALRPVQSCTMHQTTEQHCMSNQYKMISHRRNANELRMMMPSGSVLCLYSYHLSRRKILFGKNLHPLLAYLVRVTMTPQQGEHQVNCFLFCLHVCSRGHPHSFLTISGSVMVTLRAPLQARSIPTLAHCPGRHRAFLHRLESLQKSEREHGQDSFNIWLCTIYNTSRYRPAHESRSQCLLFQTVFIQR